MINVNTRKYLHVASSTSTAGALELRLNKGVSVAYLELNLSTGCLPKDLSKEEYQRCKQFELWDFGDGASYNLLGADLSGYDGIVVWHSIDVESMLLLGLIASGYNGKIYHIDVSKTFENKMCQELTPQELLSCLHTAEVLSTRQQHMLKRKYNSLPHDNPCIKKYIHKTFVVIDKEVLKKKLLRFITTKPQSWLIPSSYAMAKSKLGESYYPLFWDCLTLELICEGRAIISEMTFERGGGVKHPLGCCLTTPYLYNGFDLRQLYSFKYFKVK